MKSDLDKNVVAAPGQADWDNGHRLAGQDYQTTKQKELEATQLDDKGVYTTYAHVGRNPDYR